MACMPRPSVRSTSQSRLSTLHSTRWVRAATRRALPARNGPFCHTRTAARPRPPPLAPPPAAVAVASVGSSPRFNPAWPPDADSTTCTQPVSAPPTAAAYCRTPAAHTSTNRVVLDNHTSDVFTTAAAGTACRALLLANWLVGFRPIDAPTVPTVGTPARRWYTS